MDCTAQTAIGRSRRRSRHWLAQLLQRLVTVTVSWVRDASLPPASFMRDQLVQAGMHAGYSATIGYSCSPAEMEEALQDNASLAFTQPVSRVASWYVSYSEQPSVTIDVSDVRHNGVASRKTLDCCCRHL